MRQLFCSVVRLLVLVAMTGFVPLFGQEMEYLDREDVNRVMEQIFDRHINKKEMTEEILKDSLRVYIEQFDPDKIYFLEWEVKPFINPSDYEMKRYLADYNRNQFTPFRQIDSLIKKAIYRERRLRNAMMTNKEALFAAENSPGYYHQLPYPHYSKHKAELRQRIRASIVDFIDLQRERYGAAAVKKRQAQVLAKYNREREQWENGYLYVGGNGQNLTRQERNHQFILHVLKALARSLDSHTSVFDSSEAYDIRSRLLKGHPGTGIEFEEGIDGVIVSKIAEGSPASKSRRIQLSDKLIKVDGQPLRSLTFKQAMKLLEGDVGTTVTLTFESEKLKRAYSVTLKRENIITRSQRVEVSSVSHDGGVIGKVTLHSFYDNKNGVSSEKDIRNALIKLRQQGPLKGLILDLRNNSGGYLSQAVKVAGLFITNGVIVISKYHDGNTTYYRDVDGKTYFDGPLVVLISRVTASAAEIVAQALQDYGVAVVVGDDHSYGKGTIQSQTVTGDQSPSYFKVTVGKYYTVSGKTPQVKGVLADIVVPSEFGWQDFGEQFANDPLTSDTIEPSYTDKLVDIRPEAKPWFFRYYLPTLQPRKTDWQKMIPELKKKSTSRIGAVRATGLPSDQQMEEAVKIIKDMIQIHSQMNRDSIGGY